MLENQCPGCSGQIDETTDPEHEDEWHGEAPLRCFKCTARLQAQEPFLLRNEHTGKPLVAQPEALLWQVTRRS